MIDFHDITVRDQRWICLLYTSILTEEAYTGVLINHRREYRNGKAQPISTGDWLRHENFYPEIIEKTTWLLLQERLKQQARPTAGNLSLIHISRINARSV